MQVLPLMKSGKVVGGHSTYMPLKASSSTMKKLADRMKWRAIFRRDRSCRTAGAAAPTGRGIRQAFTPSA